MMPVIERIRGEVRRHGDVTLAIEDHLSVRIKELAAVEEDTIAMRLIALGWTPPPGSRWSS